MLQCLAKEPAGRPRNAWALDEALSACDAAGDWGAEEAEAWWERHLSATSGPSESDTAAASEPTVVPVDDRAP